MVIFMKKRIDEASILRAIACLSVIWVHVTAIPVSSLQSHSIHMKIFSFLNRAAKFTTPAFIFISGLTLFYTYKDKRLNYTSFLMKRFKATLIPYFIWSIIYYFSFIYSGYEDFSWRYLIESLLTGSISYHLYFILTILQFYLLFGIFLYLFRNFKPNIILFILLFISLFTVKYIRFEYVDRFFGRYVFYFGFGCYTAIHLDNLGKKLWKYRHLITVGYLGISSYFAYQFYQYYALEKSINNFYIEFIWFCFCFFGIIFFYNVSHYVAQKEDSILNKSLQAISRASYYIYLSHPLVIFISEDLLDRMGILSITRRFALNVIIVYGTVVPLAILYTRLKYKIIQNHRKRKKDRPVYSK